MWPDARNAKGLSRCKKADQARVWTSLVLKTSLEGLWSFHEGVVRDDYDLTEVWCLIPWAEGAVAPHDLLGEGGGPVEEA